MTSSFFRDQGAVTFTHGPAPVSADLQQQTALQLHIREGEAPHMVEVHEEGLVDAQEAGSGFQYQIIYVVHFAIKP